MEVRSRQLPWCRALGCIVSEGFESVPCAGQMSRWTVFSLTPTIREPKEAQQIIANYTDLYGAVYIYIKTYIDY